MSNNITVEESIFIAQPTEVVYDFTQDYSKRPLWDSLIKEATVVETTPHRIVTTVAKDGSTMTLRYQQEDRPHKTSLAMTDVVSQMMESGGEVSWEYEEQDGGTLWTQVNKIVLKDAMWAKLMLPVATKYFKDKTLQAMQKAKEMME